MLHAIDADTHLFESTQVWDFIDEEMYARRPIIVSRCLERIGDHAVDIGEQTAFLVTGEFREFTDASH